MTVKIFIIVLVFKIIRWFHHDLRLTVYLSLINDCSIFMTQKTVRTKVTVDSTPDAGDVHKGHGDGWSSSSLELCTIFLPSDVVNNYLHNVYPINHTTAEYR